MRESFLFLALATAESHRFAGASGVNMRGRGQLLAGHYSRLDETPDSAAVRSPDSLLETDCLLFLHYL